MIISDVANVFYKMLIICDIIQEVNEMAYTISNNCPYDNELARVTLMRSTTQHVL